MICPQFPNCGAQWLRMFHAGCPRDQIISQCWAIAHAHPKGSVSLKISVPSQVCACADNAIILNLIWQITSSAKVICPTISVVCETSVPADASRAKLNSFIGHWIVFIMAIQIVEKPRKPVVVPEPFDVFYHHGHLRARMCFGVVCLLNPITTHSYELFTKWNLLQIDALGDHLARFWVNTIEFDVCNLWR